MAFYKLPHTDAVMWFDRERADLEPADEPQPEPEQEEPEAE